MCCNFGRVSRQVTLVPWSLLWMGKMERELQWWKGELAADIHQSLRIKVSPLLAAALAKIRLLTFEIVI